MEINMHAILSLLTILIICLILGDFTIIKYLIIGFILLAIVCFIWAWLEMLKE